MMSPDENKDYFAEGETKAGHAAQLDSLLEENAMLRRALEGKIDPRLFGPRTAQPSPIRKAARRVVPDRFHATIARWLKRWKS